MSANIAVCIPTIPPRRELLMRAIGSVAKQNLQPTELHVASDYRKVGAGPTRTRAIKAVSDDADWIAFLDDDDEWYDHHLESLYRHARETGADVVYPWFDVVAGGDPFPQFEGQPWIPESPHLFPICVLARAALIKRCVFDFGGFPAAPPGVGSYPTNVAPEGDTMTAATWSGDDWPFWCRVFETGAKIEHLPSRTWLWHHDSGNTSGLPSRW